MGTQGTGSMLRSEADQIFYDICEVLDQFEIIEAIACGSYRRGQEVVNDLDVVITTKDGLLPEGLEFALNNADLTPMSFGKKQAMLLNEANRQIDLNSCEHKKRGPFILHWTGSARHNIYLRKLAMKKGMSLSQHGLKNKKTGEVITGNTETIIFKALGIDFVMPEDR